MLLRNFSNFFCAYCLIVRFCFLVLHWKKEKNSEKPYSRFWELIIN